MSKPYCNKFWLENPAVLFCSTVIIPMNNMDLTEQMNTFTRMVIIIFVLLLLANFKFSLVFLILCLLFIIILYYIQKNKMKTYNNNNINSSLTRENFRPIRNKNIYNSQKTTDNITQYKYPGKFGQQGYELKPYDFKNLTTTDISNGTVNSFVKTPSTNYFCNDTVRLDFNNPAPSINQKLAGPPNPKTLIKPIIVPQPANLEYWKANNLITHSAVNEATQQDDYLSGYAISECCGNVDGASLVPSDSNSHIDSIEGWESPKPMVTKPVIPYLTQDGNVRENFQSPKPMVNKPVIPYLTPQGQVREHFEASGIKGEIYGDENYESPYLQTADDSWGIVKDNESGWVNTSCGYNPKQVLNSNLPSNLAVGNCQQSPQMSDYNKNLYTQTIQPGVFTTNQVNEPINSNIGISFQQQFEPVTTKRDDKGLHYTEHDPRIIEPVLIDSDLPVRDPVDTSNVYDPRSNGYGTSYRAYTDNMLGQTKFMYDDIDSVRMPNYIVRSNIDFELFADSYGPMKNQMGNSLNDIIKPLANDAFLKSSLKQRDDLMERLMRKRNSEMGQLRSKPHAPRQFMAGSRRIG